MLTSRSIGREMVTREREKGHPKKYVGKLGLRRLMRRKARRKQIKSQQTTRLRQARHHS